MSKEAKQLSKKCKDLIEDIFDNFDKYTDEERNKIQSEIMHLQSINGILEKYDKKWTNPFGWIMEMFNNASGKK